ncbi:MAG: tyrosine-type recombinase/integrase [Pseudonocardiaceae bacterium]
MTLDLRTEAANYLRTRRALGFRLADHNWILAGFLSQVAADGATTISISHALAFATASRGTGRRWQAARLAVIRGFAAHIHALDPTAAELIPTGLIPAKTTRRIPYLYSAGQITELMSRAAALSPPRLGATMGIFIGLLAVTGLRGGEAAGLDNQDLNPDQSVLRVTGKYGKQRLVPLHPSAVEALTGYQRSHATTAPTSAALLVGGTGNRLNLTSARALFRRVVNQCDLPTHPGCGTPRLHDLRHTFAVNSLIDAHRQGADVDARIAVLATYLGHADPVHTYWYLTASPELMTLVSDRMTTRTRGQRP